MRAESDFFVRCVPASSTLCRDPARRYECTRSPATSPSDHRSARRGAFYCTGVPARQQCQPGTRQRSIRAQFLCEMLHGSENSFPTRNVPRRADEASPVVSQIHKIDRTTGSFHLRDLTTLLMLTAPGSMPPTAMPFLNRIAEQGSAQSLQSFTGVTLTTST